MGVELRPNELFVSGAAVDEERVGTLDCNVKDRTMVIDDRQLSLKAEILHGGVSIAAYTVDGARVSPIYGLTHATDSASPIPPNAQLVDSLMDFIEGELRRLHLLSIGPIEE